MNNFIAGSANCVLRFTSFLFFLSFHSLFFRIKLEKSFEVSITNRSKSAYNAKEKIYSRGKSGDMGRLKFS